MDIATILGIVMSTGFMVWSILISGDLGAYYDFPSVVIVLGGTVAATMMAYPMDALKVLPKVLRKAFFYKDESYGKIIEDIIELANVARRDGLLALEEHANESDDEFLEKSIMLIVDGTDPDLVRNILETELTFIEERHGQGQGMVEAMGAYAPGFGMIGTLIGLINMLKDLDDPDNIGPQMSVALITTFYGSYLANGIFIPLAQKLKVRSQSEILAKELIVEGLLSIQAGENPRIIEEKLKTFVPPEIRAGLEDRSED